MQVVDNQHVREVERGRHERTHDDPRGNNVGALAKYARLEPHEQDGRIGALPVDPGHAHLADGLRNRGEDVSAGVLQHQVRPHAVVPVVGIRVVVQADQHQGEKNEHERRDASPREPAKRTGIGRVVPGGKRKSRVPRVTRAVSKTCHPNNS